MGAYSLSVRRIARCANSFVKWVQKSLIRNATYLALKSKKQGWRFDMSWIQKLYETYEQCKGHEPPGSARLMPISHTPQQIHIEITLDAAGNFKGARIVQKEETFIPATEKSAGRTGAGALPHPLCDQVQYCANDYLAHGGKKRSFFNEY